MDNVIMGNKRGFNGLFKREFDIGYQLMEAKLYQENC